MHIVENTDFNQLKVDLEKRGDQNEPERSEIKRPLKIIYNVACQADLTADAATSNRSHGKTIPKFYNFSGK